MKHNPTPTAPKRRGRPSKYTPEMVHELTRALTLGATRGHACKVAGISEDAFARYMKIEDFAEAVKKAEGKGILQWLAVIEKAALNDNWQAAAWKLERRYPEQYGRSVVDNRNIDLTKLSDDELEKLARGK